MTDSCQNVAYSSNIYDCLPGFLCAACEGMYSAATVTRLNVCVGSILFVRWDRSVSLQSLTFSVACTRSRVDLCMCDQGLITSSLKGGSAILVQNSQIQQTSPHSLLAVRSVCALQK